MVSAFTLPGNRTAKNPTPYPRQPDAPVWVELEVQGSLFKIKHVDRFPAWKEDKRRGWQRGVITEFSSRSRKRLLETFARLDKRRILFSRREMKFVTLTYPDNMTDAEQGKRDLDTFLKRLRRRFPQSWGVWRMEYQQRGAVHFHLIVGGVRWLEVRAAQRWWSEITGTDAKNSLDMEPLRSWRGVMSYAAKYLAKPDNGQPGDDGEALGLSMCHNSPQTLETTPPGRFWGVWGREHAPWAEKIRERVVVTLLTLQTWAWGHPSIWANPWQGCTIFCHDAQQELQRFDAAWVTDAANNATWAILYRLKAAEMRFARFWQPTRPATPAELINGV